MSALKKYKNRIALSVVILIPTVIWLATLTPEPRFQNIQTALASFGELTGIIGSILFAISLILSTRFIFLEKILGGLNNLYNQHSNIGQFGLILLLLHPLLLIPRYSSNFSEALSLFTFNNSLAINYGLFSLYTMLGLIIITLYLRPKYNLWKITHKLLGIAFFVGSLHIYFIPSYTLNINIALKFYVLSFAILGILSFLYKTVFGKYLIKKTEYTVTDLKHLSDDVIEISLSPVKDSVKALAGQFIFISFLQDDIKKEFHPFSISCSPQENLLKITVKNLGDYTNNLIDKLQKNTLAIIEGPFGNFSYKKSISTDQIWIAGGIGVTPFISFANDLYIDKNKKYNITLFYCVKNKKEAIYLNSLSSIENSNNISLKIIPFYSDLNGYIDADYISKLISNIEKKDIFICAPPKMINALKTGFINNNIPIQQIHSEEFNF